MSAPPQEGDWIYELKFDGYRTIAVKNGSTVELYSRNAKEFTPRFPEIAEAVAELLDRQRCPGRRDRGRRRRRALVLPAPPRHGYRQGAAAVFFYVFDLLNDDGTEILDLPLYVRRERLEAALEDAGELIRYSAEITGEPKTLLEEVRRRGLEGISVSCVTPFTRSTEGARRGSN